MESRVKHHNTTSYISTPPTLSHSPSEQPSLLSLSSLHRHHHRHHYPHRHQQLTSYHQNQHASLFHHCYHCSYQLLHNIPLDDLLNPPLVPVVPLLQMSQLLNSDPPERRSPHHLCLNEVVVRMLMFVAICAPLPFARLYSAINLTHKASRLLN